MTASIMQANIEQGTSDASAVRYDATCGREAALKPAPEAGTWFEAYFEQLLTNASPAL